LVRQRRHLFSRKFLSAIFSTSFCHWGQTIRFFLGFFFFNSVFFYSPLNHTGSLAAGFFFFFLLTLSVDCLLRHFTAVRTPDKFRFPPMLGFFRPPKFVFLGGPFSFFKPVQALFFDLEGVFFRVFIFFACLLGLSFFLQNPRSILLAALFWTQLYIVFSFSSFSVVLIFRFFFFMDLVARRYFYSPVECMNLAIMLLGVLDEPLLPALVDCFLLVFFPSPASFFCHPVLFLPRICWLPVERPKGVLSSTLLDIFVLLVSPRVPLCFFS